MKKGRIIMLLVVALSVGIVTGMFIGRNAHKETVFLTENVSTQTELSEDTRIDINTASASQLSNLPGIGEILAGRIVEYRSQFGSYSSTEGIMQVEGIGLKKYEQIKHLIKAGG